MMGGWMLRSGGWKLVLDWVVKQMGSKKPGIKPQNQGIKHNSMFYFSEETKENIDTNPCFEWVFILVL